MKLSVYTIIALFITAISAPAFAEKPEGEVKRYKVTLEQIKPKAANAAEVEASNNEALIEQDANDEIEAAPEKAKEDKSKWWKPWGKEDEKRKEAGKGSEVGQQKREEHSRKWWKPWSADVTEPKENSEQTEATKEPTKEAAPEKAKEDKPKWWKPWGKKDAPQKEAEKASPVKEPSEASTNKWWKPWN